MTLSALLPVRRHWRRMHARLSGWRCCAAILPAFAAAGCLAACAAAPAAIRLPPKPGGLSGAQPAAAAVIPATPQQQVTAALVGYTSALSQAEHSGNGPDAARLLRPYLAAGRIGGLVAAIRTVWLRGQSFYGQDVLHILSVHVRGQRAFVHDCDDTSGMGLHDATTGQAVPGSAGTATANLVTQLRQINGRWLVVSQLPEDVPCAG